ncbi:MAG: RusA family crossover junction endodeoxyribonuclease [Clostridium sp.]|uniref:RusA family crossover junction endodeoxyribonuclease n=1 Tax=Clostridium sp. TaxID=1506 RepID=UPI003F380C37
MELRFTVPIPPSVNSYLDWRSVRVGRKVIPRSFPSNETKQFQVEATDIIVQAMNEQQWIKTEKNEWCVAELIYYFQRKGCDTHNHTKVLFDVMTKCEVYADDQWLIANEQNSFIDKDNPRIEVVVKKIEKMGMFDNEEAYNKFYKEQCSECKLNKKTCKYMKEFLDNRVHNIRDDKCINFVKYKGE